MNTDQELTLIGWREWLSLPDLNIPRIKAKVDTGARSSALHAFVIEPYQKGHEQWVMFALHPEQKNIHTVIECHAPVKDYRLVSDSGGHKQKRYVIETTLNLGSFSFVSEITLTNRDSMRFRMLLGRTAMHGRFMVNPSSSYVQGVLKKQYSLKTSDQYPNQKG